MTFRDEFIMNEKLARFLDPISLDIMKNPVIASDGKTYDHHSITSWMEIRRRNGLQLTSPMTNLPLRNTKLTPDLDLKQEITNFLASKGSIKLENIKFSLSSDLDIFLDRITSSLVNLKPPQIIVLGNESHGKSSLLERIVGLPLFPRNKYMCTRCVVRVQLRRTKKANPLAEISIVNKQQWNNHSSNQNLRTDIKMEPSERVPIDNIRKVVNETMELLLQEQPDKLIINDREIVIKIELPFVLNLDLVDLPGLITTSPSGCKQDVAKISQEIALDVIEKENDFSFYILVNDVHVSPNQSRGCELIQIANVQNKTLGLFTKIDTFSSEDSNDSAELNILLDAKTPASFPVGYGWMATSNQDISTTVQLLELQKLYQIDEQERRMIEDKFLTLQTSNRVGINQIRQKIQSLYDNFVIENWIPTINSQIVDDLYRYYDELKKMGLPFGQINEYQTKLTIINRHFKSDCSYFSFINHRIFNKIVNLRSHLFLSKENEYFSENKNLQSFYVLRETIINTLYKMNSTQLQENYENSELNPFEDAEEFIKRKIEIISNDYQVLFSYLNDSIKTTSEALFVGILTEEDEEDPKILERFPLAVQEVNRVLNEKTSILQIEFKQWFDKSTQELFAFDKMNPFEIIKLHYAPMLITQPDLLNQITNNLFNPNLNDYMKDIQWSWTNPSKYEDFIELMLYQYFQFVRNCFSNFMTDVLIPKHAFQTDSDIPLRDQYLTYMANYIEVICEIQKLNEKD